MLHPVLPCCILQVFKYSVHGRFGSLISSCTTSRLQLAALYAASSTQLREPTSKLTGSQTAMQLVRHSWTNELLSTQQQRHLQDISSLGGFQASALRLLCYDLAASACQLQHLHVPETGAGAAARRAGAQGTDQHSASSGLLPGSAADTAGPELDADAVTDYMLQAHAAVPAGFLASFRGQLTPAEESWLMHTGPVGLSTAAHSTPDWKRWGRYKEVSTLPKFPVAADYVQQAETHLLALVQEPEQHQPQPFPLPALDSSVSIACEMMAELQDSWDCYQQHPEPTKVKAGVLKALTSGPYALVSTQGNSAVL